MLLEALRSYGLEAHDALRELAAGSDTYEPRREVLRDAPLVLGEENKYSIDTIAAQLLAASPGVTNFWKARLNTAIEAW